MFRTSPRHRVRLAGVLLVITALATACGGDGSTSGASGGSTATEGGSNPAAWTRIELTDVDGTTFTLADLEGTPVVVENFATWCSNCLRQLGDTQKAAAAAGESAAFVALSVETDIDPADVRSYAEDKGFSDIRFAVMTPEMAAAIQEAFGTTVLNPPSTPKIVIDADGTPGELATGFESPDEIAAKITAAT